MAITNKSIVTGWDGHQTARRRHILQNIMKKVILILLLVIGGVVIYFSLTSTVTKNIDTYIYELPFKEGTSYKVVQGYGGMFSHKNKAAIDFYMPEETRVYAARGGIIYSCKDNSNEGGPFPKTTTGYGISMNSLICRKTPMR